MPTHQSIGGASDEQLLQRMVSTHADRYGATFWELFDKHVAPALPPRAGTAHRMRAQGTPAAVARYLGDDGRSATAAKENIDGNSERNRCRE